MILFILIFVNSLAHADCDWLPLIGTNTLSRPEQLQVAQLTPQHLQDYPAELQHYWLAQAQTESGRAEILRRVQILVNSYRLQNGMFPTTIPESQATLLGVYFRAMLAEPNPLRGSAHYARTLRSFWIGLRGEMVEDLAEGRRPDANVSGLFHSRIEDSILFEIAARLHLSGVTDQQLLGNQPFLHSQ